MHLQISPPLRTPPFSSEEEVEGDGILQSYISPELSQPVASKSSSKSAVSRFASQSDVSSSEEEEVEKIKANPQPSRSMQVSFVGQPWGGTVGILQLIGKCHCHIHPGLCYLCCLLELCKVQRKRTVL